MYYNETTPAPTHTPSATKPTAIRLIDSAVLDLTQRLARELGVDIKVSVELEGLDRVTVMQAAEWYNKDTHGSGDYVAVTYEQGKDSIKLCTKGLPFDLKSKIREITQPFPTRESLPY